MKKFAIVDNIADANAITHGGIFHADDVMATAILVFYADTNEGRQRFPTGIKLYRSVGNDLSYAQSTNNALIYDVGGGEFDHHIKAKLFFRRNGVPYAACGLIWRNLGQSIGEEYGINPNSIDKILIEPIDARDNGLNISSLAFVDETERTPCSPYSISDILFSFNPNCLEDNDINSQNIQFTKAVEFAYNAFERLIERESSTTVAAWTVNKLIDGNDRTPNPDILILNRYMPWKGIVLSRDDDNAKNIKAAIYKSTRGGYQWLLAPTGGVTRETRVVCPERLKGLDREALTRMGYKDASFIHPVGFTGGADTITGCIDILRDIIDSDINKPNV